MSGPTPIEWAGRSWNPVRGCTRVSEGCRNCYAERIAGRFCGPGLPYEGLATMRDGVARWTGKLALSETALVAPLRRQTPSDWFVNSMSDLFHETIPDEWIDRVFAVMVVCSQHEFKVLTKRTKRMLAWFARKQGRQKLAECIAKLYVEHPQVAARCPLDTDRAIAVAQRGWPLPNVSLGTSCEDQATADARIPALLATPAAVRFVSAEPLLGSIDLSEWIERIDHCGSCSAENSPQDDDQCPACGAENHLISTWGFAEAERYRTGERYDPSSDQACADEEGTAPSLDWVIVGGESGRNARPMHPQWARDIRDQCAAAGAAFFFKQWGEWTPAPWKLERGEGEAAEAYKARSNAEGATHAMALWPGSFHACGQPPWSIERVLPAPDPFVGLRRAGKRAAGRLLDGIEHNGMPETRREPAVPADAFHA